MKEKTFEELIIGIIDHEGNICASDVYELLQQVREATIAEIESKANEYGEFGTADYVHEMPTDRIKLTERIEMYKCIKDLHGSWSGALLFSKGDVCKSNKSNYLKNPVSGIEYYISKYVLNQYFIKL